MELKLFKKLLIIFFFFYFSVFAFDYKVYINEILPSPEGADDKEEWIEIFNENDFEIDLSGWKISDKVGKTKTYIFPKGTKIPAKGYLVLDRPTTKITLNNEGDELILFDLSGEIVDKVSYQKAPTGKSWIKTESGWIWTSNPSPGKENFNPSQVFEKKAGTPPFEKEKFQATLPRFSESLVIFLIAFLISIFSAVVFLILKKRLIEKNNSKF